ncbi:MAG: hypothetical protein ACFE9L_10470 [Candidatus Hodarchaeota archaeon]
MNGETELETRRRAPRKYNIMKPNTISESHMSVLYASVNMTFTEKIPASVKGIETITNISKSYTTSRKTNTTRIPVAATNEKIANPITS